MKRVLSAITTIAIILCVPVSASANTLPDYYSSVDKGYVKGLNNQSFSSACWTFVQNEVIEAYIAKTEGKTVDYAEQTMKFETSVNTMADVGFDRAPNDGGNEYMSTAYLARAGSALEADEPFSVSENRRALPELITRHGYLKGSYMFNYGTGYNRAAVQKVKQLVYDYGAAGTAIYFEMYSAYEDSKRTNYCYDGAAQIANHSVTIVGWDDNYSKQNFKKTPAGDGAFIVKNSWGNYHNNGTTDLVYISYYDKFITNEFFTSEYSSENNLFDNVYQYDHLGYLGNGTLRNSNDVLCITKFDVTDKNQAVTAVSTYAVTAGVAVEVFIDCNGGAPDDKADYVSVCKKTLTNAGYHLVTFDGIRVTGDGFNVAVRYTMPKGTDTANFPVQMRVIGYSANATSVVNKPDTCYFGKDFGSLSKLEDKFAKSSQPMLCIKAFTKNVSSSYPVDFIDTSKKFTDVPKTAWYKTHVDYAVTFGMFSGSSKTTFSPSAAMTRAQFVQVLANLSGVELNNKKRSQFSDVGIGEWYTGAINWASANGIVKGMGAGKFGPSVKIDRQQMCVMLVNYAKSYLKIILKPTVKAGTFGDHSKIASWAQPAVYECYKAGIISGTGSHKFSPALTATRAEAAAVLSNFHKICN